MRAEADPGRGPGSVRPVLAAVDRESRARLLAALVGKFRDLDLAEDALQEALSRALKHWPREGIPRSPEAWIMTVAKRAAVDELRGEQARDRSAARVGAQLEREPVPEELRDPAELAQATATEIRDDRLGLFFACAHPALKEEDRLALTLRFVAGLTTTEIAHALLMPRPTLQQRITRAKARVRRLGIAFSPPAGADVEARLPDIRRMIYLLFSEGFARSTGDSHVRADLTAEAIRLAELLEELVPGTAETRGLIALLVLSEARRDARTGADGLPVPLAEQDRGRWDRSALQRGIALAERAAGMRGAGGYAIQAAIAAVHAEAGSFEATDWRQIAVLYGMLEAVDPGPVVRLGRAIAIGRASGPAAGLELLDALGGDARMVRFRPFHVARAVTLAELGDAPAAAASYERALEFVGNEAEVELLEASLAELQRGSAAPAKR